jgi:hypothetical protein
LRPDEQERRDAQSAAARGEQPQPDEGQQQVNVPIVEQHTHLQLLFVSSVQLPDGGRAVQFLGANGVMHIFPLDGQTAQALGQQLVAPSVQIAGADEMPGRNGHKPEGRA